MELQSIALRVVARGAARRRDAWRQARGPATRARTALGPWPRRLFLQPARASGGAAPARALAAAMAAVPVRGQVAGEDAAARGAHRVTAHAHHRIPAHLDHAATRNADSCARRGGGYAAPRAGGDSRRGDAALSRGAGPLSDGILRHRLRLAAARRNAVRAPLRERQVAPVARAVFEPPGAGRGGGAMPHRRGARRRRAGHPPTSGVPAGATARRASRLGASKRARRFRHLARPTTCNGATPWFTPRRPSRSRRLAAAGR